VEELSQKAGVSHNAVSRLERDAIKRPNIKVLGRLLAFFVDGMSEAFPEGDPYDHIIPPKTLGSWIQNQRLRRALGLHEFARLMRVHVYSTIRYERDAFRPNGPVQRRLKEVFGSGVDRFLNPAKISNGARGRPASEGNRTTRSRRHAQKKQAHAPVRKGNTRVRVLG
jgi:transcriptional regulator with XRE-family HTH domain